MAGGRVPADRPGAIPPWLLLAANGGWRSTPLDLAATRRTRCRGLIPASFDHGLLLAGRSVHGFGMRHELSVLALDEAGTVLAVRTLRPRRVLTFPAARWLAELPPDAAAPQPGTRLLLARRMLRR